MELEREDVEGNVTACFDVLVRGEYTPAERGSRDYYGAKMEPDWPAKVEFLSAENEDGEEIELNKYELRRAECLLESSIQE
jgi:hypothetical protein